MEDVSRGSGFLDCKGKTGSQREGSGGRVTLILGASHAMLWNFNFDLYLEPLVGCAARAVDEFVC